MTPFLVSVAVAIALWHSPADGSGSAADTVVTHGLPPYVSGLVRRSFVRCTCTDGASAHDTALFRLRALPGVQDLRTRTVSSGGSRYLQVFGRHRRSATIAPEPRSRPGLATEAGARLSIDGALGLAERVTVRIWQNRDRDESARAQGEIALVVPILRPGLLSAGAVATLHSRESAIAAVRLGSVCRDGRTELSFFAGSGDDAFAGALLRVGTGVRAIGIGLQGTALRAAGVRAWLTTARGGWELSIEGSRSAAGSTLLPPATRAVPTHGRPIASAGSGCFVSGTLGRVLFPAGAARSRRFPGDGSAWFRVAATIDHVRADGRTLFVPALTASASLRAQQFTAAAASYDGFVIVFRWNAWPGGSSDLVRADRLMRELGRVTGDETPVLLRRW